MVDIYGKYVGRVFDNRYRIEQVIGIGGMAVVFKATDLLMRRVVAVKILKDEISSDEQTVKRFRNEYKVVSMLSHPNIVNIYDMSVRENIKYIVMEYVEGITLKNYMQRREVLNFREMISYSTQILRALDHAHKQGVVHRDIKPQNIMLLKNGVIKVMDFGIAKLPNAETLTMTDKAIGTVYYISPEQVGGGEIDGRSDIYSLGVMMYEMATGRLPFTAENPVSIAMMQVNETAVSPRQINPHIPLGLEQIIVRAMEKNPDARYQSAEEMLSHITKLKENPKLVFKENKQISNQVNKAGAGPKKPVSRSMFPIIMGVTTAFLLVAGLSGYYILDRLFFSSAANQYETIEVANFVGATYTDELADWFEHSEYYSLLNLDYAYSDTVESGRIMVQEPEPGERKKVLAGTQKCEMGLTVSLGVKTVLLEDYSVRDYREVRTELQKLDIATKVTNVSSEVYEIGYVVRTDPPAGTIMNVNDTVELFVSQGSDTMKEVVPNFVGMNELSALAQLVQLKFSIGTVKYVKNWQEAGTVVSQSATAWIELPLFTPIDFEISGGWNYEGDGTTPPEKPKKTDDETDAENPDEGGEGEEETEPNSGETGEGTDPWTDDPWTDDPWTDDPWTGGSETENGSGDSGDGNDAAWTPDDGTNSENTGEEGEETDPWTDDPWTDDPWTGGSETENGSGDSGDGNGATWTPDDGTGNQGENGTSDDGTDRNMMNDNIFRSGGAGDGSGDTGGVITDEDFFH